MPPNVPTAIPVTMYIVVIFQPITPAKTSIAISFIIGEVIMKLIATPNGMPASINPINIGIEEQEQKGVIAPNIEADK